MQPHGIGVSQKCINTLSEWLGLRAAFFFALRPAAIDSES
jgi:hypothetical protein